MIAKLLDHNDPMLRTPAKEITVFDEDLKKKFETMIFTLASMEYGSKLGMAFPQIGIPLRGIIVLGTAMANPIFRPVKDLKIDVDESCYSLPGKVFRKIRPKYGWIKYQNPLTGEWTEERKTKGLEAIVIQHELDHLEGRLCDEDSTPLN